MNQRKEERTDPSRPPELAIAAQHLTNPTSVEPAPPASPAGFHPLYRLHLLNPSLQYGLQISAAYSSLGHTNLSFVSKLLNNPTSASSKFLQWKVLVALDEISEIC